MKSEPEMTARTATRTRKAATAPEATEATVSEATETAPEAVPATTVNKKRAAIVARIKATVGTVSKGSASLLTDVTALTEGIKAEDFADVLMPEIGSFRVGRVLTRKDSATLIKALRDDARDGGKVKLTDVANVLGVSTGQVSTLANIVFDDMGGEVESAGGAAPKSEKTAVDVLTDIEKAFAKALKREDANTAEFHARVALLMAQMRKALPGTHDGNMGGAA